MLGALFFIGTAGCGKTSLVKTYSEFLGDVGADFITVNLDPAVLSMPYNPDVDVRNYVSIAKLLDSETLGPNGAIVAAMDMIAADPEPILHEVNKHDPDYVLVDTPGQLELFAFREVGPIILNNLTGSQKAAVFLLDPIIAQDSTGLASLLMLSVSSSLRLGVNTINALSKADILSEEAKERILGYFEEPEEFVSSVSRKKGLLNKLASRFAEAVFDVAGTSQPILLSAYEFLGIAELHAEVQRMFSGGEVEDPGNARD